MRAPHGWSPTVVALTGLTAVALPMGIGRFAFTPLLPMMHVDAGLSIAAGGWLAAANYLGTLLGALLALSIRISAPTAIRAGLVTIGAATLLMGTAHNTPAWVVLRLLAGLAVGWVLPIASAWALERLSPLRRPMLNATLFAGYGVGIAGAGLVCLGLMSAQASSAQAWVALGALSMLVTVAIWPLLGAGDDEGPSASSAKSGPPPRPTHRWDADTTRLVVCYGVFGFGYIIPATFLPVMARRAIQDPAVFGLSWPLFGAAASASTFLTAHLARSLGNRRLWSLGHLVMAVGVVLPALRGGIVPIMISALLVGATFTVITMAGFQEGRELGGVRTIAAMASAFSVGQTAGPLLVSGLVRADGGFSEALVIASALLILSALVVYGCRRGERTC